LSLLSELRLQHETALGRFIEKISTISEAIIAELLGDALRVWAFRTLLDEIVQKAQNLEIQALQAIIFIIIQLLRNCVVVALEEILALLVGCFFVFHGI